MGLREGDVSGDLLGVVDVVDIGDDDFDVGRLSLLVRLALLILLFKYSCIVSGIISAKRSAISCRTMNGFCAFSIIFSISWNGLSSMLPI